ncbi:MAG: ATP synthase subunit I [Ignavibacteriales bacterium]|nr:ATP synthase subunit I [Ignavibacteriales bacterium]
MQKKAKIALIISVITIMFLSLLIFMNSLSVEIGNALILAIVISVLNFLLFLGSFNYSVKKSNKIFLLFTVGGMGIRLLLMLAAVFVSIKFLKVDLVGFIFGFFIWYVFLLIYEISIVQFGLEGRKTQQE